ncbi:hypothetical protein IFM89_030823 [Coptis chinensis]|uniref:Uncharacterized protein n=1 Tax=Coptis chinensis TaxID=261450 RepID=A0A835HVV5_9MAGN|nr:hypothetical protein IFM89_030823 [Coptis chinensis]
MMLELEKEEVKEMRAFDSGVNEEMKKTKNKRVSCLRKGSEGVKVHAMQTSLGTCEDGIMTAELLEKLFMEQGAVDPNFHESTNGASVASVTEVLEIKQNVIKESEVAEFKASHHHVFLLGENRWEDSSRLVGRNKEVSASKVEISTTTCIACRGEGRRGVYYAQHVDVFIALSLSSGINIHIDCTKCDGTGEPNIEPQFLECVDEGTKCPYCEGLGYNICDVCEGKTHSVPD